MLALALSLGASSASADDRTDPLQLPTGPTVSPESLAGLSPAERVGRAADLLGDRGYAQLPVQAWAMLELGRQQKQAELVEYAAALAPGTPAIQFAAARELGSGTYFFRTLGALAASFPVVVWLIAVIGGAAGAGVLLAAAVLALLTFTRTIGLHGHVFGHLIAAKDPASWPGVLLALVMLALLPVFGVGPAILLALVGGAAALRADRGAAVTLAVCLGLAGIVLGPGLVGWARLATLASDSPVLMSAWRLEHSQPLRGDRERLERAVAANGDDILIGIALATAWLHEGEPERAEQVLEGLPSLSEPVLLARADNLRGSIALARGEVNLATASFQAARATDESAASLYNLAQAHGRAVRLAERSSAFAAARQLDPDLVSHYTSFSDTNMFRFLILQPIPMTSYLSRGVAPSPESDALIARIRLWVLGRAVPQLGWVMLPLLGVLGVAARRESMRRCRRCSRAICARCAPDETDIGENCLRCVRLFARGSDSDPRVRKQQLELDRRRERRKANLLGGLSVVTPGVNWVLEGRSTFGAVALTAVGLGLALGFAPVILTPPMEMGELGSWLTLAIAMVLIPPVYLLGLNDARERWNRARTRA